MANQAAQSADSSFPPLSQLPKELSASINDRFEIIEPPRLLRDIISYKTNGTDPVANSERLLSLLSVEFEDWLAADIRAFQDSWNHLSKNLDCTKTFLAFSKSAHQIKGNAGILGCTPASDFANTLCSFLERSPDARSYADILKNSVYLIIAVASGHIDHDDPRAIEAHKGLRKLVQRWIG